jgi:hypothetical protein
VLGGRQVFMQLVFYHLTTVATVLVLIVLILGLLNLMRGSDANLSQKLMRWRIALQFVAIVVIMVFVALTY